MTFGADMIIFLIFMLMGWISSALFAYFRKKDNRKYKQLVSHLTSVIDEQTKTILNLQDALNKQGETISFQKETLSSAMDVIDQLNAA